MRGLYVHIPFCLKKCHYCNYVITVNRSSEMRERYFEALEREIRYASERYGKLSFDTLYLGGGTPSALGADEMKRVFNQLRSHFSFRTGGEITCEVNPGDVDAKKLKAYRKLGVNRISLGVQSTRDSLLQDLGRVHSAQATFETVELLHTLGFENLSFDLMLRLPRQTLQDVKEALDQALRLEASQVVVYDLNVHAGTVFGARAKRGELELPDEETHEAMFRLVEEVLKRAAFVQYEISSFAKPGFESQHNLIYWKNEEYLGLGPGAFSYMEGRRTQYARDVSRYLDKTFKGDWSVDEEEILTEETKEMETLLTGLRLREGVDATRFHRLRKHLNQETPSLIDDGLTELKNGRLFLTRKGRCLAETVFTRLSL